MSDETDMYATLKSRLRRPSAKLLLSPSGAPLTPSTNSGSPPSRRQPATLSLQAAVAETLLSEDSAEGLPARTCSVTLETAPLNQWKLHGFSWDLGRRSCSSKLKKSTKIPPVEQENVANSSSKVEEAAPVPDTITTLKKEEEEAPLVPSLPPPLISPLSLPEGQAEDEEESSEATLAATSPCAGGEVKRKRGRPFKGQEKPVEERLMIETCKIRRLIDDIMRKGNGESQLCLRLKNIARDLDEVLAMDSLPAQTHHHQIHEEPSDAGDLSLPDTLQNLIPQENDLHVE